MGCVRGQRNGEAEGHEQTGVGAMNPWTYAYAHGHRERANPEKEIEVEVDASNKDEGEDAMNDVDDPNHENGGAKKRMKRVGLEEAT